MTDERGTEVTVPAKTWIRVGGTGVTMSDAPIELYSDEPVRLRYRPTAQRPFSTADIIANAQRAPSWSDAWEAAGRPALVVDPQRPTGRCTRCGTTANLHTVVGGTGFLNGHLDATGEPCLYSNTTSHDNTEMR